MNTHSETTNMNKLKLAIVLTLGILALEITGGIMAESLALLADAGHVFMDAVALGLSLLALSLACVPATETRTFGWHRTEIFAAFINGCALFVISVGLIREAYLRILHPREVLSNYMMLFAGIGLAVNIVVAYQLREHDRHDLNIRSAYLHVVGDLLGSVIVIIGAVLINITKIWIIDPVLSILISLLILIGSFRILKESVNILLEGVPAHLKLGDLTAALSGIPGISDVHNVHLWSICSHVTALACHISVEGADSEKTYGILCQAKKMLLDKFGIVYTTIEVDTGACSIDTVPQDMKHK